MKTIKVHSARGDYNIFVGAHLLQQAGKRLRELLLRKGRSSSGVKVMIVTQKKVARHYLKPLARSLKQNGFSVCVHLVSEGEKAKSEKELFRFYAVLLSKGFERKDMILALGGGVVGDFSGFAASSYLRGVSFINIGTTLLAQVDSSIGGKTGINLREGKNLVGAFYPPETVIADSRVLATLPDRELRSSLAEVVKYGVIRDARLFRFLEKNVNRILAKNPKVLERIVYDCAKIKAQVVSRDERETKGERMILNYGHTFGHAFEQCLKFKKIMHGEAVAVGMVCAARLAVKAGIFKTSQEKRQLDLLQNLELPTRLSSYSLRVPQVFHAMSHDKKKSSGRLLFILPKRIGKVLIHRNIPLSLVRQVLLELGCRK